MCGFFGIQYGHFLVAIPIEINQDFIKIKKARITQSFDINSFYKYTLKLFKTILNI